MIDSSVTHSGAGREPVFTPPSLPKGGGSVSAGGGMVSVGGADGSAGWSLPLPLPVGRELTPALALAYRSTAGNGAFGAGWYCAPPAITRLDRLGVPRYCDDDRWQGPDGEEILRDLGAPREEANLPFSALPAAHEVTAWVSRSGNRDQRLEHWRAQASPESPGFWLQYHGDGSITLYGWSASARLAVPGKPSHVASWYAEETVSAKGEHVVYRYRGEDAAGCDAHELAMHPQVANTYLVAVHAMNASASEALLIPAQAFDANDFMTLMQFDYGERAPGTALAPTFAPTQPWSLRQDCHSYWRLGFDKRVRRLCHDVLLWHRSAMMAGATDPTPTLVSRLHLTYETSGVAALLVAARQWAYEADGTPLSLPPQEFEYSRPGIDTPHWQPLDALDGFSAPRWQMADLHGEGLAGLLYQDTAGWWYRAPRRDADAGGDAVTWGPAQLLPGAPRAGTGTFVDLDGDGRPQWLVNVPGVRGSFTLGADGQWRDFVAADTLPSELGLATAQWADLNGSGRQDLVMIGPRSVRFCPRAHQAGWHPLKEVASHGALPLPGGQHRLVAFADLAGTGLAQWVEVTGEGVSYWPMLGHGHVADPVRMGGFAIDGFNASRVLLGDIDGSGTTDLLYVEPGRIRVFINQSGNRFVEAEPVLAPEGIVFDATCKLQLVDLHGQGSAELVLTVPHLARPRSWAYRFNAQRPWLLAEVCSNTGSRTLLDYRSSAQSWLDEKQALQGEGRAAVSHLPFAVHCLNQVTTLDDISGLRTVNGLSYRGGVWDAAEREFRGFRHVVQTDSLHNAQGTTTERSPPAQVRQWYLSGLDEHDREAPQGFAGQHSAEQAYATQAPRFTRLEGDREVAFEPLGAARRWLLRALRGAQVRSETYGLDGSERAALPYRIDRQRWQVRAYETAHADRPAALVTAVESLLLNTERVVQDPLVTQTLVLAQDAQGHVLKRVEVRYPRRPKALVSPYPASLPPGLEDDSRDAQQNNVWIELTRQHLARVSDGHSHVSGLLESTRTDVLAVDPRAIPGGGFSVENLSEAGSPLADLGKAVLAAHERRQWCDASGLSTRQPTRQALVAYDEIAVLEHATMTTLEASLLAHERERWQAESGYHPVTLAEDGLPVYVSRHHLAHYLGGEQFYRLRRLRDSELLGPVLIDWSPHSVQVYGVSDAAGLQTRVRYDWRFLTAVTLTDPNDNVHQVTLDALGRVGQTRFYGTEQGTLAGYHRTRAFSVPSTVAGMLALKGGDVPVATAHRIVADSWMPMARDSQGRALDLRVGELALRRLFKGAARPESGSGDGREPPHIISLQTDRYDGDPEQQLRVSVTHSDGGGRLLQRAVLSAPGDAMVRTEAGALQCDDQGRALLRPATRRWAVSGRTEYDNKGQPVRTWLPYYLDDWRLVHDHSGRDGLHADTHLYDALGRVYRVLTAAGWERRTGHYPWFTVVEDENDTA